MGCAAKSLIFKEQDVPYDKRERRPLLRPGSSYRRRRHSSYQSFGSTSSNNSDVDADAIYMKVSQMPSPHSQERSESLIEGTGRPLPSGIRAETSVGRDIRQPQAGRGTHHRLLDLASRSNGMRSGLGRTGWRRPPSVIYSGGHSRTAVQRLNPIGGFAGCQGPGRYALDGRCPVGFGSSNATGPIWRHCRHHR